MKKTMKAARWYSEKDIRVEEIEVPEVTAGEVMIEVDWCGICGSDLHEYITGPIFIPEGNEHPITKDKAPVVLGHEFAGTVKEIADDVENFEIGDKVTVEPIVSCGECIYCKRGDYHICEQLGFHGLAGGGGGLAEYTTFAADKVHKLPEGVSTKEGALIEPLSVAAHSLGKANFGQGQTATVLGAGPIGLSTILTLKSAGAQKVIAVEISEKRKEFAKEFGADLVLDPTEVDVIEEIYKYTDGLGTDASFETTGVEAGLKSAINSARRGGKVVITSIWEKAVNLNFNDVVLTEKELIGTIAYRNGVFPAVSALIKDGRIKADKMITSEISLDDLVEKGFKELINNKNDHIKILVSPKK